MPPRATILRQAWQQDRDGSYIPRQFNPRSRMRFVRLRRQFYLSRITGAPSTAQMAMAIAMPRLEWCALVAEERATPLDDRRALDARRLLQKMTIDFERSLRTPQPVRAPSLAEHLAARREA